MGRRSFFGDVYFAPMGRKGFEEAVIQGWRATRLPLATLCNAFGVNWCALRAEVIQMRAGDAPGPSKERLFDQPACALASS